MSRVLIGVKSQKAYDYVLLGEKYRDAWRKAIMAIHDKRQWKGQFDHTCTESTFRWLCNNNHLKGIQGGLDANANTGKRAIILIDAINAIKQDATLQNDKKRLDVIVYKKNTKIPRKNESETGVLYYFITNGLFIP